MYLDIFCRDFPNQQQDTCLPQFCLSQFCCNVAPLHLCSSDKNCYNLLAMLSKTDFYHCITKNSKCKHLRNFPLPKCNIYCATTLGAFVFCKSISQTKNISIEVYNCNKLCYNIQTKLHCHFLSSTPKTITMQCNKRRYEQLLR